MQEPWPPHVQPTAIDSTAFTCCLYHPLSQLCRHDKQSYGSAFCQLTTAGPPTVAINHMVTDDHCCVWNAGAPLPAQLVELTLKLSDLAFHGPRSFLDTLQVE